MPAHGSSSSARSTTARSRLSCPGAHALLFPIDWPEPFGLVMIESMACGTPVIAFDRGSVPEVIDDGVTGFIVHDEAAQRRRSSGLVNSIARRCGPHVRPPLHRASDGGGLSRALRGAVRAAAAIAARRRRLILSSTAAIEGVAAGTDMRRSRHYPGRCGDLPAALCVDDRLLDSHDTRCAARLVSMPSISSVQRCRPAFGPFFSVYLTQQGWSQVDIGFALSVGTARGSRLPAAGRMRWSMPSI